jgi:hypothetical protein
MTVVQDSLRSFLAAHLDRGQTLIFTSLWPPNIHIELHNIGRSCITTSHASVEVRSALEGKSNVDTRHNVRHSRAFQTGPCNFRSPPFVSLLHLGTGDIASPGSKAVLISNQVEPVSNSR